MRTQLEARKAQGGAPYHPVPFTDLSEPDGCDVLLHAGWDALEREDGGVDTDVPPHHARLDRPLPRPVGLEAHADAHRALDDVRCGQHPPGRDEIPRPTAVPAMPPTDDDLGGPLRDQPTINPHVLSVSVRCRP